MQTIAERISAGLSVRKMKQSDLVNATGIGKSSISTYISGSYEPKQKNIYKIAKALDVNEAWLMGYDVPMDREKPATNVGDELPSDEDLVKVWMSLSPDESQRAKDFALGMIAARKNDTSHSE